MKDMFPVDVKPWRIPSLRFDDELFVCLVVSVGGGISLIKSSGCTSAGVGEVFSVARGESTQKTPNNSLLSNKSCQGVQSG